MSTRLNALALLSALALAAFSAAGCASSATEEDQAPPADLRMKSQKTRVQQKAAIRVPSASLRMSR
jgi:hypothetical protein